MMNRKKLIKHVFGEKYDFGIPSGPALVYFYRRFGFTQYGSDPHKSLCLYFLPTAVDGLHVSFGFGGSTCYIGESMSDDLRSEHECAERAPIKAWWERCRQWASDQCDPMLAYPFDEFELYISQAEAWLLGQGVTGEITEEEWNDTWSRDYFKHIEAHNTRIRDAYKEIEPFPELEWPHSELGKQCETAVEGVLRDLLRPVYVRDVPVNVLGVVDTDIEDEVEPSPMAGYGVRTEVYEDFELYCVFMDEVTKYGDGSMQTGMRVLLSLMEEKFDEATDN